MAEIGTIHAAKISDSDALAQIYADTWRATWRGIFPHSYIESMINRNNTMWWARNLKRATTPPPLLLNHEDQKVGYISFGKSRYGDSGFEGEIYELNVLPDFQGVGVGSALFRAAHETLQKSDKLGLIAWSLEINQRCCQFYESRGGTAFTNMTVRFNEKGILKEYNRIGFSWPAY